MTTAIDDGRLRAAVAKAANDCNPGERLLSRAQAGREVIQQYVALAQSLEWACMLPSLSHDVGPFIIGVPPSFSLLFSALFHNSHAFLWRGQRAVVSKNARFRVARQLA